jgi:hypothetical protein
MIGASEIADREGPNMADSMPAPLPTSPEDFHAALEKFNETKAKRGTAAASREARHDAQVKEAQRRK